MRRSGRAVRGMEGIITQTSELLTVLHRGIFFVRWRQLATESMLTTINHDYARATRPDRAPIYCGISGDSAGTPDTSMQRKLARSSLEILRPAPEFHLVLEGSSTQARLSRSLFRGLITAAKVSNRALSVDAKGLAHKVILHDSLADCLPRLAVSPLVAVAPSVLRLEAERLGLLSD